MEVVGLILLGLVAGSLAAALGIGGGIIFVPALVSIFGVSQLEAQGTSLAIIVPTAIIATIGHWRKGRVDWRASAYLAPAGIVGAIAGSMLAYEIDEEMLQRIFAVLLVVLALRMMYRAWTIWPRGVSADTGGDAPVS